MKEGKHVDDNPDIQYLQDKYETNKTLMHKYKDLLLKQRDIMIALSQRLQERDEKIQTQDADLDEFEKKQVRMEEQVRDKNLRIT